MTELNLLFLWIVFFILFILNFIRKFTDPLQYSDAVACVGLKCRPWTLYKNLISYTFDVFIIILLTHLFPISKVFTGFWYIGIVILGYFLIYINWKTGRVYRKGKKINPPPEFYLKKDIRITNNSIVLALNIILFFTMLSYNFDINGKITENTVSGLGKIIPRSPKELGFNKVFILLGWLAIVPVLIFINEKVLRTILILVVVALNVGYIMFDKSTKGAEFNFKSKFGNFNHNSAFFAMGWSLILKLALSIYDLVKTVQFHPQKYNLPLSWKI